MAKLEFHEISSDELKKGSVYAFINAHQMFEDAMVLKTLGRYPRVYALIKLSLEEVSKSLMLLELTMQKQIADVSPEWRERYKGKAKKVNSMFFKHNPKTEYAIKFSVAQSKEFIDYHPADIPKDHALYKHHRELEQMLNSIKALDSKKNDSLYVSLSDNKFSISDIDITQKDIQKLENFTFPILIKAKQYVLKNDDDYFSSLGLNPKKMRELDLHTETRRMHKFMVQEWNENVK